MKNLLKVFILLSREQRNRGIFLLGMILVMAILDVIGVASILPFMAVLSNPESIKTNNMLNAAYVNLGFNNPQDFLIALGLIVFVLLVFSLTFKAITTYLQLRFAHDQEFFIGMRLVEGYLYKPYSWFLTQNSADLGKNVLSETSQVINNALLPMLNLVAQSFVVLAILGLLVIVDPLLALIVGGTLGISYLIVFRLSRKFLSRIGRESVKANKERFSIVGEAFEAIKEVKVLGLERVYARRFSTSSYIFARHQASSIILSQLPRYALECIAFGGLLIVMLYLLSRSSSFTGVLPVITLYAFAGYRLMPALQQIYSAVTQLRFSDSALDNLHSDLTSMDINHEPNPESVPLLENAVVLNSIVFAYPNSTKPSLKNINLTISAFSRVGFVGVTGSGKTTIADVILGLLEPQLGNIEIDGHRITKLNNESWQRSLGYVPQRIYLANDTIAANIAFGIAGSEIDIKAVERAAKMANLHEFIENDLPMKYQTVVGDRGVRLSGGQQQRIGIARALYRNPRILILDEATSALDNLTEQAVMQAIENIGQQITVILIAHRLSTVRLCDKIFVIDKGEIRSEGRFDDLVNNCEIFRNMIKKLN